MENCIRENLHQEGIFGRANFHDPLKFFICDQTGSNIEVVYKLQTFGIQERILPLDKLGMPTKETHQKWLGRQRRLETEGGNVERVLIPTNKDVLKGRGRGVQDHIGNIRFRCMVAEHQNEYDANDMFGAKAIV